MSWPARFLRRAIRCRRLIRRQVESPRAPALLNKIVQNFAVLLWVCTMFIAGCRTTPEQRSSQEATSKIIRQARVAEAAGELDRAASLYETAAEHDPDDVGLLRDLARVEARRGQLDTAIDRLAQVSTRSPDDVAGWLVLADVRRKRGEEALAEGAADRALRIDPNSVDALLMKSEIAAARQQPRKSLDYCYLALIVDHQHAGAKLIAAETHAQLGEDEKALPLLRAVRHSIQSTLAQRQRAALLMARAYRREGQWAEVVKAINEHVALTGVPTEEDLVMLSDAQQRMGDREGALRTATQALEINPNSEEARQVISRSTYGRPLKDDQHRPVAFQPRVSSLPKGEAVFDSAPSDDPQP